MLTIGSVILQGQTVLAFVTPLRKRACLIVLEERNPSDRQQKRAGWSSVLSSKLIEAV